MPICSGGVSCIRVCVHVFSKFIKLYAVKSATTKACFNKPVSHYFGAVVVPNVSLSDNVTKFRSPSWRKQLQKHGVEIRFTPIRHPESNPNERYVRELSKFCTIYCNGNHKKWAEVLRNIDSWINNTVARATGYNPSELIYGSERCKLLRKLMSRYKTSTMKEKEQPKNIYLGHCLLRSASESFVS